MSDEHAAPVETGTAPAMAETATSSGEEAAQISSSSSTSTPTATAEATAALGIDAEQHQHQEADADAEAEAAGEKPQPPAPPPEPEPEPAAAAPTPSEPAPAALPQPAVPSTRKRPSKHAAPPKPILRPPGSSHTASHNALITGVAAATASLLPTNAKPALASFLQNINTRLAQGGVGVQVPIPHGLTPTPGGMGTIPGQGLSYVQQQQQLQQQSSASSSNSRQQQQQQQQQSQQQQHYTGYGATSSSGQGLGTSSAQQGTSASALLNGVLRRFSGAGPSSSGGMGGSSSGSATPTRSDSISIRTSGINSSLFHTGSNGGTLSPVDFRSQSPSLPSGPSSQQQQQQQPSIRPLRRVQFRPTLMTVTYPIVNTIAPADEDATRRRVESEHRAHLAEIYGYDLPKGASSSSSLSTDSGRAKGGRKKVWNVDEVEELYTRCCRIRQEWPLKKMRQVFQEARQAAGGSGGTTTLRTLDLSTIPLDQDAVDPLADFLSVDFGLDKLVLENCMLTDEGLKAFLHALLISGTLPNLSLASNKKIKAQGWKYVALFIRRAQALRYLDLSENVLNKAALGEIVAALERAPRELVSPAGERRKKREEAAAKIGDLGPNEEEGQGSGHGLGLGLRQDEPELQPLLDEIPLMPAAPLLRSYDNASSSSTSNASSSSSLPTTAHYSQLSSLRLENCSLKTSTLELLAQGVRASELRHLSLRRNKISNAGASALALVLKDYPDVSVAAAERLTGGMGLGLVAPSSEGANAGAGGMDAPTASASGSYAVRSGSLPLSASGRVNQAISTAAGGVSTVRKDPRRTSYLLSPTESEALSSGAGAGVGGEAGADAGAGGMMMMSPVLPAVPEVISSPQGGVTNKRMNPAGFGATMVSMNGGATSASSSRSTYYDEDRAGGAGTERDWERSLTGQGQQGYSGGSGGGAYYDPAMAAEQALAAAKAQRAFLANLPRVGALLTLDLKSNDIGSGVVYLAQALKKNRTLRVLNLSDCNIDMAGLIAMADMLKYNATLETLDLSHNQCCGPSLEGITTLRTAFTLNSGLKRLFLSDTELSSEGAICLAEFLPEAKSLIHLDLTENYEIDIAGVMALAVSLRMNTSLRCLDLNVPPNNHEFSRLSQEILQSCVRNTEEAQRRATQRGLKQPVAAPIYRSAVARAAKAEDAQREREIAARVRVEGLRSKREKRVRDTLEAAGECAKVLMDLLDGPGPHAGSGDAAARAAEVGGAAAAAGNGGVTAATTATGTGQEELLADLLAQSKRLRERLAVIASNWKDGKLLARTLHLNDELDRLATRAAALQAAPTPYVVPSPALSALDSPYLSAPDQSDSGLSSPSFSIGSDDEDDEPAGAGAGTGVVEDNLRRASQTLASSSDSASTLSPISSRGERVAGGEGEGDDDEEEEEDEDDLVPRPSSSSSSSATRQLPSLTIDIDGLEAEKIEPPPEELQKEVTPSPAEHRAKGQLSEEGEIFRKAKSLMLVDESGLGPDDESESDGARDEEEGESEGGVDDAGDVGGSGSGEVGGSTTAKEDLLPSSSSPTTPSSPATSTGTPTRTRQRHRTPSTDSALSISSSGSGSTAMGGPSSHHHAGDAVLMIDPEVSGERLRKEILEADVPRVHRYPGGGGGGGADAAAAAETSPNAVATDA